MTEASKHSEETATPRSVVSGHTRTAGRIRSLSHRYAVVAIWLVTVGIFAVRIPSTFLTVGTFRTIFGSQQALVFLTLASVVVLSVSEIDLSIASVAGLAATLVPVLSVTDNWPLGFAIAVAVGAGVLVGITNAFFVVVVGIDSIIVTLGMGTMLLGVAEALTNFNTVGGLSFSLSLVANRTVLQLPLSFYYGIGLGIAIWYIFAFRPLGRYVRFVGSNRDVARLAGIRVDRIRVGALVSSALISAVGGVLLVFSLGGFDPASSGSLLLPAFAAAFLGTAVIEPGRFNPIGSLIAIYFLVTVITGLQLIGVSDWVNDVFYGGVLIGAVAITRWVRRGL